MTKSRIYEIAKREGVQSAELLEALRKAGVSVRAPASTVDDPVALEALRAVGKGKTASAAALASTARGSARSANGGQAGGRTTTPHRSARLPEGGRPGTSRPTSSQKKSEPGQSPAAGSGGRRRRVVIDSQAARRQQGPAGPQQQPARPRRSRRRRRGVFEEPPPVQVTLEDAADKEPESVEIASGATVKDVAAALRIEIPEVMKKLMTMGEMATITQTLSDDAVELLAEEFGKKAEMRRVADVLDDEPDDVDAPGELEVRPPVVAVMGHVDHGKTSLLDAIRESAVVAGESGGITQHIGAYQVKHDSSKITFLDTPGHEAFTAMRARGAKVTDIATIVVAADDGVMPQTEEAIAHAKAAGVPIVIAVNKIDKPEAKPEKVRSELAAVGLNPEEWGGDTIFVDVSAKTKEGLDSYLDMLRLVADVAELKANPTAAARGTIIESRLDPGRGAVVTILVERGTLRVGDAIVAGHLAGRVRAMTDFTGARISEADPGTPVEVLGFDDVPDAGLQARVVENDRRAKQIANQRSARFRAERLARQRRHVTLEDLFERIEQGGLKELKIVLKADVAGSLEALEDELAKLPQEKVSVNVIHTGVGGITESDVMLASASDAIVVGFNVRPFSDARAAADRESVEVRTYAVIYKVFEEIRAAMEGLLDPEEVPVDMGSAEVRAIFKSSRAGSIAGCMVTSGRLERNAKARLVRDGRVVYDGSISTLRRHKDDVKEVGEGFECGLTLKDFADVKQGDVVETYSISMVEQALS